MIPVYRCRRLLLHGLTVVLASVVLITCNQHELLWVSDHGLRSDLHRLSDELARTEADSEEDSRRYGLIMEIAFTLRRGGQPERERTFLTLQPHRYPDDPYNAAYLVTVADSYEAEAQTPLAVHYYRRVLRGHADLEIHGQSLHLYCLRRLLDIDGAGRRIEYYEELIERFSTRIDLAFYLYRLADSYAEQGSWSEALSTYTAFLNASPTEIPGEPRAYRRTTELINFHHSDKSWVRADLMTLLEEMHTAIARRDMAAMRRLQAKTGFFATSWGSDATLTSRFRIEAFSMGRVRADGEIHPDSNEREAFLRTTGWTFRVRTWYLYFRRVDYGIDPRVDGSWEWAGIYFGEKL